MIEVISRTFGSSKTDLMTKQYVLDALSAVVEGADDKHVRSMFENFLMFTTGAHRSLELSAQWASIQVAREDAEDVQTDVLDESISRSQRIEELQSTSTE